VREIKFRSWDNIGKTFRDHTDPLTIQMLVFHQQLERGTLEQFTGLFDKNGKEIYEGDIVAHDDDFKHPGAVQFCKGLFGINWNYAENPDPEWKDGQLYGGWGNEHNLRKMGDGFNREMVTIGNVHENPELLK